jgi:hypothetical protein
VLRLGCGGCLTVLLLLALVGAGGWAVVQAARVPEFAGTPVSAADGLRAQQKIFDLLRGSRGGRSTSVTLSEREVNAFLSRHVSDLGNLKIRDLAVRLPTDGRADLAGRLPLGDLLTVAPLSALRAILPAGWVDHDVWLTMRTRVTLEGGPGTRDRRHVRLDVERFWLGRLPLPELMARVLLDPSALRMLRAPVPQTIDGLRVEPGRLVIQAAT